MSIESDGNLATAYIDRNLAVQAFAALVLESDGNVGLRDRESEWPILYMDLPNGAQVSWHIPRDEVIEPTRWPEYRDQWDRHDSATKRSSLHEFIAETLRTALDGLIKAEEQEKARFIALTDLTSAVLKASRIYDGLASTGFNDTPKIRAFMKKEARYCARLANRHEPSLEDRIPRPRRRKR